MSEPERKDELSNKIQIEYVKSNLFRVIHTDGAIADENPTGDIAITLFSQRFSVPEKILLNFNQKGELISESIVGDEGKASVDRNIIREVDIISIMSVDTARELAFQILGETGGFEEGGFEEDELDEDELDEEQEDEEHSNE